VRCPQCESRDSRVVDSRDLDDAATIRRRRECSACGVRFTTYERVEAARLIVIKRDGVRQEFDRDKLAAGLRKALTRRPVPVGAADRAVDEIETVLRAGGTAEVDSARVEDERLVTGEGQKLGQVRLRLPDVDVRVAVVAEDPEAPVQVEVD